MQLCKDIKLKNRNKAAERSRSQTEPKPNPSPPPSNPLLPNHWFQLKQDSRPKIIYSRPIVQLYELLRNNSTLKGTTTGHTSLNDNNYNNGRNGQFQFKY